MNGSSINYNDHMEAAHAALARCAFSKVAIELMDDGAEATLDALDDAEDLVLAFGMPKPQELTRMRDELTDTYRVEMQHNARLSVIAAIAAIPTRLTRAANKQRLASDPFASI